MARISYVTDDQADAEVARIFEQQRRIPRRITNFHRLIAHVPRAYKWYLPFSQSIYRGAAESRLDLRTRQIAQIRTSVVNSCDYCTAHNTAIGEKAGLTDQEVAALHGEIDMAEAFSGADLAVAMWAESVALNHARRDQKTFEMLRAHFSDPEIAEITLLIAARTMVNRVQEALWTDMEPEQEISEIKSNVPGSIDDYIRSVLCPDDHPTV